MSSRRNPLKDQVAIVGVGTTDYVRHGGRKTRGRLAVEASIAAIRDAGISRDEIDGICGSNFQVSPQDVQQGLGLPRVTWFCSALFPMSFLLTEAVNAVFSGSCTTALVYQATIRTIATSSTVDPSDPIRAVPDASRAFDHYGDAQFLRPYRGRRATYPGYMRRYMHRFGVDRKPFGMVAVNNRTHASANPHAALRTPLTIDDYLGARMVRDPMCVLDMDYTVDGGDALIVTTAERARDLRQTPVLVHAIASGQLEHAGRDEYRDIEYTGQAIAMDALWGKSDVTRGEVDVLLVYDGFSIISLRWLENFGYCPIGEAGRLLEDSWDSAKNVARIGGRLLMNPHGGSLSEGATQGSGHVREAVHQLRGGAGARQIPDAKAALLGVGGLFFNSSAMILRRG